MASSWQTPELPSDVVGGSDIKYKCYEGSCREEADSPSLFCGHHMPNNQLGDPYLLNEYMGLPPPIIHRVPMDDLPPLPLKYSEEEMNEVREVRDDIAITILKLQKMKRKYDIILFKMTKTNATHH